MLAKLILRLWFAASSIFIVTLCIPSLSHAAVGRTVGVASVSPWGAATYSIPLTLPPGTNGLAPSLSLNYSHNSGDGLLGVGWSVTQQPQPGT